MNKIQHLLILIALLSLVAIYFDYPAHFNDLPRSAHQWRQSDGASMALNYYQNGMDFWKPQLHNTFGGNGYCVSEFTGLYYLVGGLYHLFGVQEGIFRLAVLLIFFVGLLALARLIFRATNDEMLSYFVPLLIMGSPVMAFYAFSFLPNIPAFSFVLIGWMYFFKYYEKPRLKYLYLAAAFFLLGGLFKITALLSVVPIFAAYFLERIGVFKFKKDKYLFEQRWAAAVPLMLVLVGVGAWYLWAMRYNETHHTNYFLMGSRAIWNMEMKDIRFAFSRIFNFWSGHYFPVVVHALIIAAIGFVTFTPKRQPPFLYFLTVLSSIGAFLYVMIWLGAFIDHDYYAIELMIVPVIALVTMGVYFKNNHPRVLSALWFKYALGGLLIFSAYQTKQNLDYRQQNDSPFSSHFNPSFYEHEELMAFLKENGIQYPDKVVSIPDRSPNNTLYYMNLTGWTELFNYPFNTEKVKIFASYGAKYLIITDKSYLENPELQGAFVKPIANFKQSIFVFDVQGLE